MNSIDRLLENSTIYSSFRDNIWSVDLADMQSLSRKNKGIRYLLRAIDLFSKYAWIVSLKDKRGISIDNAFKEIISKGSKPNEIWFNQGIEFKNYLLKRFLRINSAEMYSTYMKENLFLVKDLLEL